jgi:hypothetical protein
MAISGNIDFNFWRFSFSQNAIIASCRIQLPQLFSLE